MLRADFRGLFVQQLRERVKKWEGTQAPAARIVVPDELRWWYFNEFGTATKWEDPGGRVLNARLAGVPPPIHGKQKYQIVPVDAKALAFPVRGTLVITKLVNHPGIRPSRSVTKALADIERTMKDRVRDALYAGAADDPTRLKEAVQEAAEQAIQHIAESMSRNLAGAREAVENGGEGKLGGRSAAEVFQSEARIV